MDLQKEINDFQKEISEYKDSFLTKAKEILSLDFIVKNRLPSNSKWFGACNQLDLTQYYGNKLIDCLNSLIDPIEPLRISGRLILTLRRASFLGLGEKVTIAMVEKMREGVEEILYHFNNEVLLEIDYWAKQVIKNQIAALYF